MSIQERISTCKALDWLDANVSDHYAILSTFRSIVNMFLKVYKSESQILTAWRWHFGILATPENYPDFDGEYEWLVASEMLDIMDIFSSVPVQNSEDHVYEQQVKEAKETMDKRKAADVHGNTGEHFLNGGPALLQKVSEIINSVFSFGSAKDALSIGTLTPIFKNKGSSTDV